MANLKFKCTNFGGCTKADKKEIVEIAPGEEPLCPECEKRLFPANPPAAGTPGWVKALLGVTLLLAVAIGGWWATRPDGKPPEPERKQDGPKPDASPVVRLKGSNTVALAAATLAEEFIRSKGGSPQRTAGPGPNETRISGGAVAFEIQGNGSDSGFAALGAGQADIAMSSRKIRAAEVDSLKALGDLASNASEKVVALDVVVAAVHPSNGAATLSEADAAKLLSGETRQWPGGPAARVHSRAPGSATRDFAATRLLKGGAIAADAVSAASSEALDAAVAADPGGIAFLSRAFVSKSKAIPMAAATSLRQETEADPWTRRLYFYIPANASPQAREFDEFARSKPAQKKLEELRFVGQTPEVVPPPVLPVNPPPPPEYTGLASSSERITIDLRFRYASRELDSKALDDLGRIVEILKDPKYAGRHIVLIGFADSSGNPAANLVLSKDRAAAVADELRRRGIQPAVITGFGASLPVAPNDTEEGREKNRRVEVWLRK